MSFTRKIKTLLDRKALRFALIPLVNHLAKLEGKGIKKIFYDDGVWVHETSRGYFAYHEPYVRLDISRMEELARLNFLWGYTPKIGDIVIDVGAGVGEEALTFSRAVGEQGRVICIEAHPRTYRCLEKLVQYNELTNAVAIQRAVAQPSCHVVTIENSDDYLRNRSTTAEGIPVAASTIDAIQHELGLGRIHFLKMNIEGAERLAIRGMAETLKLSEVICISCHDFLADATGDDRLRTKSTVKQFLQKSGLQVVERNGPGAPPYVNDQVWAFNKQLMQNAAS